MKVEVKVRRGNPAETGGIRQKQATSSKAGIQRADGTGEAVTAETVVTDEMEVYAVFEQNPAPIEEVKVVFDVDGVKTEVKVIKGEAIGSNLPADPTKDGYTFKGWNTKADGTGEAVTAETVVTNEMEVYAVFEQNPAPIEEVKVVIDVDGVKSEVKVIKGEAIGSNLPADPTKEGYTFKGWNTKADGTGETVTIRRNRRPQPQPRHRPRLQPTPTQPKRTTQRQVPQHLHPKQPQQRRQPKR